MLWSPWILFALVSVGLHGILRYIPQERVKTIYPTMVLWWIVGLNANCLYLGLVREGTRILARGHPSKGLQDRSRSASTPLLS